MVERAIGEMVGSDPSSARKITCEPLSAMMSLFNQSVTKQLRGVSVVLRSKCIDTAEIVRDGRITGYLEICFPTLLAGYQVSRWLTSHIS
jgi:hypothetical protein